MFLKLRILFCILSALCLVVIIPAAVWGGWIWFGVVGGLAFLFFMAMLLCKQQQENSEQPPKPQTGDFFQPAPTENDKNSQK